MDAYLPRAHPSDTQTATSINLQLWTREYSSAARRGPLKAAAEEPVLPADRDEAELILGGLVIQGGAAILEEGLNGRPLIGGIPNRVAQRRFLEHGPGEGLALSVDL